MKKKPTSEFSSADSNSYRREYRNKGSLEEQRGQDDGKEAGSGGLLCGGFKRLNPTNSIATRDVKPFDQLLSPDVTQKSCECCVV